MAGLTALGDLAGSVGLAGLAGWGAGEDLGADWGAAEGLADSGAFAGGCAGVPQPCGQSLFRRVVSKVAAAGGLGDGLEVSDVDDVFAGWVGDDLGVSAEADGLADWVDGLAVSGLGDISDAGGCAGALQSIGLSLFLKVESKAAAALGDGLAVSGSGDGKGPDLGGCAGAFQSTGRSLFN